MRSVVTFLVSAARVVSVGRQVLELGSLLGVDVLSAAAVAFTAAHVVQGLGLAGSGGV